MNHDEVIDKATVDIAKIEAGMRMMIEGFGLDLEHPHLKDTPKRVAKAYVNELFAGLYVDPASVLTTAFEEGDYDEMITVRNIPFVAFCAHHWLPFTGKAHVGYLPDGKIIGLSKIPRLVCVLAARPTVQEKLTHSVAEGLMNGLKPKGCGVVIESAHSCAQYRGIKAVGSDMVTTAMRGLFLDNPSTKAEFLEAIRK
jgi:GTP cyclohydrolase I